MGGSADEKRLRRLHRRFYINPRRISGQAGSLEAELDSDTVHHIRTVMRIGEGAKISLFDGTGREYLAEIIFSRPDRVRVKITEQSTPGTESKLQIVLAQALLKEQAFDQALTTSTELGVTRIFPIISNRVVVKVNPREADRKLDRWERILREAAAQSGRVVPPEIGYAVSLEELLKLEFQGVKLLLWEKARGGELKKENIDAELKKSKRVMLLIGPEGGFEDAEAEKAIDAGFTPLGLGPRIFRAGTAPIAAIAIIQYIYGDLSIELPLG